MWRARWAETDQPLPRRGNGAAGFWLGVAPAIALLLVVGALSAPTMLARQSGSRQPVLRTEPGKARTPTALTSIPTTGQTVPVLMYHHIMPVPNNRIAISPAEFDAQMRYLQQNGWHAISMAQMRAFVLTGKALPSRSVLITFDDGRLNQYTYAVPILRQYGFTATFFVVEKWVDSIDPSFMHVGELKRLSARGYDIESHTTNHWVYTRKSGETYAALKARGWNAFYGMRTWMTTTLGTRSVPAVAYSGGFFDDFTIRLAQEAGYQVAFTTRPGYVAYGVQSPYALPRWNAGARGLSLPTFTRIMAGATVPADR